MLSRWFFSKKDGEELKTKINTIIENQSQILSEIKFLRDENKKLMEEYISSELKLIENQKTLDKISIRTCELKEKLSENIKLFDKKVNVINSIVNQLLVKDLLDKHEDKINKILKE